FREKRSDRTAAALLPQPTNAHSSQLVLAPRGRSALAGRPPALGEFQLADETSPAVSQRARTNVDRESRGATKGHKSRRRDPGVSPLDQSDIGWHRSSLRGRADSPLPTASGQPGAKRCTGG